MFLERSRSRTARPYELEPHRGTRQRVPQRDGHRAVFRVQNPAYRRTPFHFGEENSMSATAWRFWAFFWIAIAAFFAAFWWTVETPRASYGLTLNSDARTDAMRHRVIRVERGSSAERAGIRVGDSVTLAQPSPLNHLKVTIPQDGDSLAFTVVHGGVTRAVTLHALRGEMSAPPAFVTIWRLAMLFVAALIAWRRPDDAAARNLVAFLTSFAFGIGLDNNALPNPLLAFFILLIAATCAQIYGLGAIARFAANFPTGSRRDARWYIAFAATAVSVITILVFVGVNVAVMIWDARPSNVNIAIGLGMAALIVASLANFVLSFRRSSAADRQRIVWLLLTFVIGFSGLLAVFISIAISAYNPAVDDVAALTLLVLPVGLGYVILRHRLLDINFVINRALVFAILSGFVVVAFVALEWILGRYFINPAASTAIQLGGALLLGLSLRPIHARIDGFVDDVFFRQRHQAESALRRFAYEALLISNEATLFDRAYETICRWSGAARVEILIQNGSEYVPVRPARQRGAGGVSQDDPAFLSMRTWRKWVDLTDTQSRLRAEYAFPFLVRGSITGAVACGAKPGNAPYAPDEIDALAEAALGIGLAHDALQVAALKEKLAQSGRSDLRLLATEG